MIKAIETYEKYDEYKFKKPKSLYKLVLNGKIPDEIFEIEEGNEPLWKNVSKKTIQSGIKYKSKLYFQIEGYALNNEVSKDNSNSCFIFF